MKPVPENTLLWKPFRICRNAARLTVKPSHWPLMPISYSVACSGSAKREPVVRLTGRLGPSAVRIGEGAGGGLWAVEPGMKSAANGRESADRLNEVALKPVAWVA